MLRDSMDLDDEGRAKRLWEVNELLKKNGFEHDHGNIQKSETPYTRNYYIPILYLEGFFSIDISNSFLRFANLRCAYLLKANLEKSDLWCANLQSANLLRANLNSANLSGVNFRGAVLERTSFVDAKFRGAIIGSSKTLDENEEPQIELTEFTNVSFLPSKWKLLKQNRWKDLKRLIFYRWSYTDFANIDIDNSVTKHSGDLYRYVKDQQFLYSFKNNNPVTYWLWRVSSDCGGSILLIAFWAFIVISIFALLYSLPFPYSPPAIISEGLSIDITMTGHAVDPRNLGDYFQSLHPLPKWFFVSFDIFTSFGIRGTYPLNTFGLFLVITETILGYVTLGLLISVLTNKFARRS